MEFEFDKEIDSLLRQATAALDGEAAFADESNPKSVHLDADEISLFAENALPVKMRVRATEHLADCDRCRKILSNVISLNAETKSENVPSKEIAAIAATVPWYKNLFAFPKIAFAMGVLALVFSGIIGGLILKNATESQNSSIAQIEKASSTPQADVETENDELSRSSNSSSSTANMSINSSNRSAAATNTTALANSPIRQSPQQNIPLGAGVLNSRDEKSAGPVKDSTSEPAPKAPLTINGNDRLDEAEKPRSTVAGNQPAPPKKEIRAQPENNETIRVTKSEAESTLNTSSDQAPVATMSARKMSELPINGRRMNNIITSADSAAATDESKNKDKKTSAAAEASRTVGGKTFKRADGVWYDSAYNQQKTINVRRGTEGYKKLDSGLRSIAEKLDGTIVVVWKGKAYRIQ